MPAYITPAILRKIRAREATNPDIIMLWATATLCFFGFFRAGELTIPSLNADDQSKHLSWGDISVDNTESPSILKVQSKTDQFRKGVDMYIGKTGCPICPLAGVLAFMAQRGNAAGPFFTRVNGQPLTKSYFVQQIRSALQAVGLPYAQFAGHS